jgi:hypothetical protein
MCADLLFTHGVVRTFDSDYPAAEALAVERGRIVAVGANADILALRRTGTQVIDLRGKTVLPGFIDAHQHQVYMGLSFQQVDATAAAVASIGEILERVRQRAERTPSGEWIEGRGYHDARLQEKRNPTRDDLDRAAPDHPVFLTRVCGHIMSVNSRALQLAGINRNTPDPAGGSIDRDPATGEPTGVLRETAMQLIRRVVPLPSPTMLRRAILDAAEHNLRHGITSVWEPSIEPDQLEVYRALAANGELPVRVVMAHKKVLRSGEEVPIPPRFTGDWLSLVAVKLFQDGGFGGATAALTSAYTNAPETRGLLVWEQDALNQHARAIHEAGLRISIHAIGDAAIISVLDAIEYAVGDSWSVNYRHRIEHCGLPLPPIPERLKRLNVVVVLQPPFLWNDGDVYMDRVGAERSRWLYPIKTLLDGGVPVAGSSDAPVVPDINPLLGIKTAVTRKAKTGQVVAPEERISVEEAISLYTTRAAYACGEEEFKGSLSVGKFADLVVLGEDPFRVNSDELSAIPIEMVVVNGRVQFS